MKTELKPPVDLFCKTPMQLIRRIRELEAAAKEKADVTPRWEVRGETK